MNRNVVAAVEIRRPPIQIAVNRARIPAGLANDLLRELFDLGIHRQSLMPSMENTAGIYSYVHKLYAERGAASIVLSPAMMDFLESSLAAADETAAPPPRRTPEPPP